MKLPFFNRAQYIVLKAYTNHAGVFERAPLTIGRGFPTCPIEKPSFLEEGSSYATCYSRIQTSKLSVTIPAPADIRFSVENSTAMGKVAGPHQVVNIDFNHDSDFSYGLDREFIISKMCLPWALEEKTGTKFVLARHMANKTMMNVMSGVLEFKTSNDINIFNLISKHNHQEVIPFLTPMASLYALSDLPIHLECEYSKDDFQRLFEINYKPHWRSDLMKENKNKKM